MKTLLKIFAGVVVALVLLIIAIPFLLPVDYIFEKVSTSVEQTTGRTLTIKGEKSLSVFPSLKLELNDVRLANLKASNESDMVSMKQLAIHIPYLSVLSGDVELEKFVIQQPRILLEKMSDGQVNWQLVQPTSTPTPSKAEAPQSADIPEGFDIMLGEVAIYDGEIEYVDHQAGTKTELTAVNVSIELPSLFKDLTIKGQVTYLNEAFELDTQLTTPAKVIRGNDFSVKSEMNSSLLSANFSGEILKAGKEFKGSMYVKGNSVKNILSWQNIALEAKENALNQFELDAQIHGYEQTLTLSSFKMALDELAMKGSASIVTTAVPSISANMDLGMLDLNPYLPVEQAHEDNNEKQSEVAQPIIWDDTELDLSGLNAINADIKVKSTGLIANKITLGENDFSVQLNKGIAKLAMTEFNAYSGKGVGSVIVNANQAPYKITTDFKLIGIDAEPLLSDAAGFDKLMGKGELNWQLTTQGKSQKAFMSQLAGDASFSFNDGAVKGANIAALVRKAKEMLKGDLSAVKDGLNAGFDKSQQTDFTALTGSMKFNNGVGNNTDLYLASPLIRITGSGTVDLPKTQLSYRLVTGIVDSIEGQGTKDTSTGFKIPVKIKGPFHDVSINLDMGKAAEDEVKNKAKDKIKDKLKGLFG
ncbi:AsmA protein [Pseudoalteromonas ulvae UL12]|uniref:AsmA family protein n=1 Tax=Pseudoalteromonas ulvae TaxID=107327 RepID=UPI00186B7AF5|nr:AsmA family protein [Pseudoalteromonas ulvae]MBE0361966.1 AsmA protein [Pseudoalteromonas ulvae UL12]